MKKEIGELVLTVIVILIIIAIAITATVYYFDLIVAITIGEEDMIFMSFFKLVGFGTLVSIVVNIKKLFCNGK